MCRNYKDREVFFTPEVFLSGLVGVRSTPSRPVLLENKDPTALIKRLKDPRRRKQKPYDPLYLIPLSIDFCFPLVAVFPRLLICFSCFL